MRPIGLCRCGGIAAGRPVCLGVRAPAAKANGAGAATHAGIRDVSGVRPRSGWGSGERIERVCCRRRPDGMTRGPSGRVLCEGRSDRSDRLDGRTARHEGCDPHGAALDAEVWNCCASSSTFIGYVLRLRLVWKPEGVRRRRRTGLKLARAPATAPSTMADSASRERRIAHRETLGRR